MLVRTIQKKPRHGFFLCGICFKAVSTLYVLSDESKLCKQCHSHKIIEIENENATKHDNIPFKTIRFCRDRFPFDSNEWCDICLSEECTNCHKTFVFMHDSCDVLCQACDDFLNNDIIGEHVSSNEQSVALQLFYLFKN